MAVIDAGSPRMPLGGIQDKVGDMQIIRVDSLDDGRLALYTQLTEIQLRNRLEPDKGIFIAESPKVIDRALAAGVEPVSFLVEEAWLDGMKAEFDQVDRAWGSTVPVFVASAELLHRLTGYRLHRGALSAMHRWVLPTVEEVCKEARRVAVLENIVDYTNVGAIMRSWSRLPAPTPCIGARPESPWAPFSKSPGPASEGMTATPGPTRGSTCFIGWVSLRPPWP